jgi:hypothetical protein
MKTTTPMTSNLKALINDIIDEQTLYLEFKWIDFEDRVKRIYEPIIPQEDGYATNRIESGERD